ncbi:MAG: hypothetical protein A2Y33_00245 [Spirochaetes bacterium GWF1_51_8]|nr:MAG: hypothetical protein A2Y33_00245 [Spirochaetes bacterium GWF1_51_8]
MEYCFLKEQIKYDGRQLSSHFAYKTFGLAGNSIVGFIGPVEVELSEMVDIEDVRAKEPISSDRMLNLIVEVFDLDLHGAVWMQRLLMSKIADELNRRLNGIKVLRKGDDLFFKERKLSVSIATASPVSVMVHSALNILPTGAPVPISCLQEMKVEPVELALSILESFAHEFDDIEFARVKVNWVM